MKQLSYISFAIKQANLQRSTSPEHGNAEPREFWTWISESAFLAPSHAAADWRIAICEDCTPYSFRVQYFRSSFNDQVPKWEKRSKDFPNLGISRNDKSRQLNRNAALVVFRELNMPIDNDENLV